MHSERYERDHGHEYASGGWTVSSGSTMSELTSQWCGLRTGHGRLELTKFHTPALQPVLSQTHRRTRWASVASCSPSQTSRMSLPACPPARCIGAELIGDLEQYEDSYRLCYVPRPRRHHRCAAEQLS